MVDGDRPKWRAIDRNEQRMLSHREISSRSERPSACLARCRSGGRIPSVGEITEKTEEDSRSNRRPIELIGSPACQRSQIQTAERPSNKCDVGPLLDDRRFVNVTPLGVGFDALDERADEDAVLSNRRAVSINR
jgi:hypothetical protein